VKLVRYGNVGAERPGIVDAAGRIRDLGGVVPDFARVALTPETLKKLGALNAEALPLVEGTPRIGP